MPLYCELPIWGDVFEPLNTISNLAFIVSAYFVWRLARKVTDAPIARQLLVLASFITLIGVGSGLWHFFREPWALALDVIPIQLFLLTLLWFLVGQLTQQWWLRTGVMGSFVLVSALGPLVVPFGAGYGAALCFAAVFSGVLYRYNPAQARYFILTLLLFAGSLTTRQLDLPYCGVTDGHGLHIFWHLLNGYVLYRFARTLTYGKMTTLTQ